MKANYTIKPRKKRLARLLPNRQSVLTRANINVQTDGISDIQGWNNWCSICSDLNEVEVKYNNKTFIQKNNRKRNFYIVANGTEADFHEITIEKGIQAKAATLDIELSCELHGSTDIEFGVIEYGASLTRIKIVQKNASNRFRYTPSAECRRFLPFIKISGTGKCVINALYIDRILDSGHKQVQPKISSPDTPAIQSASHIVKSNLTLDLASTLAHQVSCSNGVKLYKKQPYSVGIITDEYMYNYYRDVFKDTVYLTPDNYSEKFEMYSFDIVLYVSCWKGLNNDEWRGVKYRDNPCKALDSILRLAREAGAKTVFQTIEDPSNFEYFLPVAKKFDYIFTSDVDMMHKYIEECGHSNVFYGEYGVNPAVNNPIDCRKYVFNNPFFAGSYARRYVDRCNDTDVILDSLLESGVEPVIIDRNFGSGAKELQFPDKYKPFLYKPVSHEFLQKLHKLFRYNINLNSIKNSPTMCAMRVYELQAQCTNIISNYAKSTLNKFPNVRIVPTKQDLSFEFNDDALQWVSEYKLSNSSARSILSNKCSYKIVGEMLKNLGLEDNSSDIGKIAVIYDSPEVINQIESQSIKNLVPVQLDELSQWQSISTQNDIRYFTYFYEGNKYGVTYLEDMLNGFAYTNSSFITKPDLANVNTAGELKHVGHTYTNNFTSIYSTLFDVNCYNPLAVADDNFDKNVGNGYMIDPFNFNEDSLDYLQITKNDSGFLYSIVVPTYNNGTYLIHKCLASLKRHSNWERMEVIVVDDGSTDEATKAVIKQLCDQHPNVRSFFYEGGGSGSASRPRNKGVELASTNYVGFLDPDNEISPGGYDTLFEILTDEKYQDLDFISGYHAKIHSEVGVIGKHANRDLVVIDDPMESFFLKGRFPVIPTQPALIKKDYLEANNIRYVEGAAGQDTLYGWEVLLNSKLSGFTDQVHLIYYAERTDSITNVINKSYFDKKLIMEKAQVEFLKQKNLLEIYKEHHFDSFMENWYLPKVELCDDREHALNTIELIRTLYHG